MKSSSRALNGDVLINISVKNTCVANTGITLPFHGKQGAALVGVAQVDITRGVILFREHFLEMLVEPGLGYRVQRPTPGERPPADDIDFVLTIVQFGPVLRSTVLLHQTFEERLSLVDGKVEFVTLARAVNLRNDLHNNKHTSLMNVVCPSYIIFVLISVIYLKPEDIYPMDSS